MDHLSSGFSDVDHSSDPSIFASCLATLNSLSYFQDYKRKSFDLMGALEGSRVLEVGCGLGFDAISLRGIVGRSGRVVALDSSLAMLEAARSRAKDLGLDIDFVMGDAGQMGFVDGCFDCARVDRTLQHIPQPEKVLAEMARVTRSGGRIVAYEPDWGTFTIGSGDRQVTCKLEDFWSDNFKSGWIGRYLYKHFQRLGLVDIQICPSTLLVTDLSLAEKVFDLSKNVERARSLGLLSMSEAIDWLKELREDDLGGIFFCSYTGFMAVGRKR
ncbi:MAG: class I SAM-dependent methyltransferase [Methanothrix sp.]|jgi:ubiquinone/menaquinone biosynthesis C-methylase UbiE|nr:class I SAM-dependent methyltransferase [Methanothrix sp.]